MLVALFRKVLAAYAALSVVVALGCTVFVVHEVQRATLVARIERDVALGAALALVCALALGAALMRAVGRKLQAITAATHALASGDYSQRLDETVQGDWLPLTVALNTLAAQLRERETLQAEMDTITDELNATVLSARDVALESSRLKSEFLANMSHEIRTPMTAVLGYADLLLDPALSPSDRLNHVLTIRRNGEHLLAVLNDILDLSKIEAGRMEVEKVPCSPNRVLIDVASLMRVRASERGLAFDVKFLTPVPRRIETDPTRLHQILTNLVGNAIKFTSSGCVRVLVSCRDPQAVEPSLVIDVEDTGVGMTTEQVARIFQPFTQADASTTRRYGGTGLGLAISHRLAMLLGGHLAVTSVQGRGSTFSLTVKTGSLTGVPMAEGLEESVIPRSPSATPNTAGRKLSGRVLLAEDGRDNQLLISTHLRRAGLEVSVVENGRLAVDAVFAAEAAGRPFALVFMDMQMPELDGYGAAAELRARGCALPIVALTAHAMAGDRERCLVAGCTDYLTKPIASERLLAAASRYTVAAPTVPGALPVGSMGPTVPAAPTEPAVSMEDGPLVSELAWDPEMTELIAMFCGDLAERVVTLETALGRNDRTLVRSLAHQLRGAGGGFGYPAITDAAAAVERLASADNDAPAGDPLLRAAVVALLALCRRAVAAPQGRAPTVAPPAVQPVAHAV